MSAARRPIGLQRWMMAALAIIPALFVITPPAANAQERTIRVLRAPVGAFEPLYIADEKGYFAELGLSVEITVGGGPDQNIAQVMAGQTDIIMTGAVPLVAAVANGVPMVATLGAEGHVAPATTGLMVPGDSAIHTLADFRGKKIGLPGIASPQGLATLLALEAAGISQNEVALVNLPFDAVVESAQNAQVDGAFPIGLFYTLAISQGFREFPDVVRPLDDTPAVLYATTRQWATDNAEALAAFNQAMLKAYDEANANHDLVRDVDRRQTQLPPDFIDTRPIVAFSGTFNRTAWDTMNQGLARFGFLPSVPSPADFIWQGAPQ